MLSKTDLAIADIALQVGFSSQNHLTQQFKHLTGLTPKQVRQYHKNLKIYSKNLKAVKPWKLIHFKHRTRAILDTGEEVWQSFQSRGYGYDR